MNINLPLNGAELPSGQPVGVYAEAVSGTPVKDLELWVDGVFVPTRMSTSPDGQIPFNATWLWTPAEDGNYRLVVRAIGQDNAVTVSNVVRVAVLPADEIVGINVINLLNRSDSHPADAFRRGNSTIDGVYAGRRRDTGGPGGTGRGICGPARGTSRGRA